VNDLNTILDPSRIALFLDFDGTLVEIAETPDAVVVPQALAGNLQRASVALDGALAIISGRTINSIDHMLGPLRLPVAGGHGAERRRAYGQILGVPDDVRAVAAQIADELAGFAAGDARLILEPKPTSVALHFRRAPEREVDCVRAMQAALAMFPSFVLTEGKMVVEARARDLDKGGAIRAFMQEAPFAGRTPVFIGDDVTDEDGFRVVQELGGLAVKVGADPSVASQHLCDVNAVHRLVGALAGRHT
jgi:trehalose 6-phosphate phosphatase